MGTEELHDNAAELWATDNDFWQIGFFHLTGLQAMETVKMQEIVKSVCTV